MPGDISRKIFNPLKNYSGALTQQGRVQLDSDWNEQLDIYQHRLFTETVDVIGQLGVPQNINGGNSFKIFQATQNDFTIGHGHMYVGGLLCELANDARYFNQPWYKQPDTANFTKAASGNYQLNSGTYIVYVEAWQREVTFRDDPRIQEVALGGPDTTTRLQTVWQVKLLRVSDANGTCATDFSEWQTLIRPTSGKMNARTQAADAGDGPCVLPPSSGYRRTENQLYRIEIQKGGNTLADTTFKWSRDNATVETLIRSVSGQKIYVDEIEKDAVLGFKIGDWTEIVDEISDLNATPSPLLKIIDIDPGARVITVDTAVTLVGKIQPYKLRKWDQTNGTSNGIQATTGWLDLEDGIQVQFSEGNYKTGQHWFVPARTLTGEIEWPPFAVPNVAPIPQPPVGIQRHYGRLAVLKWDAATMNIPEVLDCRPMFPPLTEKQDCDCACITVRPGPGWEAVFTNLPVGEDYHIHLCFQVGEYPLQNPIFVGKRGHILMTGAGAGSRIIARNSEAAIVFDGCRSICVRDLYVETGRTGFGKNTPFTHLNGGLHIKNCSDVHIDTVDFKNGTGNTRAATCLTIRDAQTARVMNCDFKIGHLQQGILLVNTKNAMVQNNTFSNYASALTYEIADFPTITLVNESMAEALYEDLTRGGSRRRRLPFTRRDTPDSDRDQPVVREAVKFNPSKPLIPLAAVLNEEQIPKDETFSTWARTRTRAIIDEPASYIAVNPDFGVYYAELLTQHETVAAQAITVGGTVAEHIHISGNVITDVLVGIHVGLSHHAERDVHDHCKSVVIADNSIKVKLPLIGSKMTRHGIFVGNCRKLSIENNYITLQRFRATYRIEIDGIRAWGFFGPSMKIMHNVVIGEEELKVNHFSQGIRIHSLNQASPNVQQWVAMWNVAPSTLNRDAVDTDYSNAIDLRIEAAEGQMPTNIPEREGH